MAIPTRKEWRKIRDDAGGKEGESKKVSVGKTLDTYHKAAEKAIGDEMLKPLQDLEKNLLAYYDAVKASNPKLAKAVNDKLIAEIAKEKKGAKGVASLVDKVNEGVEEIAKLMKKDEWEKERDKVAGLFRLIRAAADQLNGLAPDVAWAQIHRMTILAHGDIEKLDKAIGTKDQEKIDKAKKQAEGTVDDALKAIKKHAS